MLCIWRQFYNQYIKSDDRQQMIDIESLYELPREDNIKKIRAVLQNEKGIYLPTDPQVRKKRKIEEYVWQYYLKKQQSYG